MIIIVLVFVQEVVVAVGAVVVVVVLLRWLSLFGRCNDLSKMIISLRTIKTA